MTSSGPMYDTLRAFYAERPERRTSPESDYGVHWHTPDHKWPTWKLAHIDDTGEVYVVSQDGPDVVGLLTMVPAGRDMDVILGGWQDPEITGGFSLGWVEQRLTPAGYTCPSCWADAGFALTGSPDGSEGYGQAFCSNDACRLFSWEPFKTRAEIIHEMTTLHLPSWLGNGGPKGVR